MRDILLNKVPVVLTSELYGTIAIIVGIAIFLLDKSGLMSNLSLLLLFFIGLFFRLIAYYNRWHLPKIN